MPLSSYREFDAALAFAAQSTERTMERLLPKGDEGEAQVFEAMRYSSLGGGKRLRAFFVLAGATLFKVGAVPALRTASAIEFVHAYSLIHDDLPAMDDDDLRRGKPSCHKQFDEATAILAGDALQTLAFEVLADTDTHGDPAVRAHLVVDLAKAAGAHGMVGGQMLDLLAEEQDAEEMSIGTITRLQRLKTGALISFSCTAGAILGKAAEPMPTTSASPSRSSTICSTSRATPVSSARRQVRMRRRARRLSCRSSGWNAPARRPACWRDRPPHTSNPSETRQICCARRRILLSAGGHEPI